MSETLVFHDEAGTDLYAENHMKVDDRVDLTEELVTVIGEEFPLEETEELDPARDLI